MSRKIRFSLRLSDEWQRVAPFFKAHPDGLEQVRVYVPEYDDTVQVELLTVKSLLETIRGDVPKELSDKYKGRSVREWCAMLNSLRRGMENFISFMESTVPPVTIEQKKLTKGALKGNVEEAMLWTMSDSYTLHGLEDAQNLTVYEYMVARKNRYNEAIVAYNQSMAATAAAMRRR